MGWIIWGSHPVRGMWFLFTKSSRLTLGPTQLPSQFFPRSKAAGWNVDHLPPSGAETKKVWSYTSPPPIFLHGMNRDSCTSFILNNKSYYYISNFMCILSRHQVSDLHIKKVCHFSQLDTMYQLLQNHVIMVETTCLSTKKARKKERKNKTFRSAITYRKIQSTVLHI
jgi:hypothetical protein